MQQWQLRPFAAQHAIIAHDSLILPRRLIKRHCIASLPLKHPDIRAKQPLLLPRKPGLGDVYIFGVEHETHTREPADFILKHKPAAVIFENSFSAAGGNGAIVSCTDKASHDGSLAVLSLCRLAAEMRSVTNAQQLEFGWQ